MIFQLAGALHSIGNVTSRASSSIVRPCQCQSAVPCSVLHRARALCCCGLVLCWLGDWLEVLCVEVWRQRDEEGGSSGGRWSVLLRPTVWAALRAWELAPSGIGGDCSSVLERWLWGLPLVKQGPAAAV